ncbi:LbetaH domain-containing protein [Mangrovibacterium diazotrophicum]|uniref:Putative colanic acid biosynthesis acetyltransferase WcaF n=1 Tax=Mangrovibacterium diazotrophicum TaxID=1261403 RepID=A0A419VWV8_9BACT|nr:putative colanic acid biosynthesis acetyltransferase [Mangrovibacterium diazotrophicum]RKD87725.1 putative colanic acid biosynthesis acetyltransferase WcaF [Mangrovibacterium diazotrophicum]
MEKLTLNNYTEPKPKYFKRLVWLIINRTIFRCFIGKKMFFLRTSLLKLFGADMPFRVMIYPSCKIHAPWNLRIGKYACIGPNTEIYNKAFIDIGANTVISQGAFLCSASHDISKKLLPLVSQPITIADQAWIAADTFIGPGVTVGQGAVVGARSAVFKDVEAWVVVGGNPAKFIKKREIEA